MRNKWCKLDPFNRKPIENIKNMVWARNYNRGNEFLAEAVRFERILFVRLKSRVIRNVYEGIVVKLKTVRPKHE
jgi:hypothetical protein